METTGTNSSVSQFFQYAQNGTVDIRKTVKAFEDAVKEQLKAQEAIKPTIVQELKEWKRLGEMTLVANTLHALHLPNTGGNVEKVRMALKDLESGGKITYQTNEAGSRKGRNAGWTLSAGE